MSEIAAEVTGANKPGGEAQASPVDKFSFSSLHEQAMAAMGGGGTPDTSSVKEQVTDPNDLTSLEAQHRASINTQPKAEDVQNVDAATSAQIAQLKDTDLVEVTVAGQKVTMPWGEARGGVMRQADYTRGKQELARERDAFKAEVGDTAKLKQNFNDMVTLLSNKAELAKFIQQYHPELSRAEAQQVASQTAADASQVDPDDIVTVGQVQQAFATLNQQLQQRLEAVTKGLDEREQHIARNIQDAQATAKLANEINSTVQDLFKAHPYIKAVNPRAEEVLRWEVHQMQPQTAEEALEAVKTVFGSWVDGYKSTVSETTKQTVINKQKLIDTNIQPSGGAAVQQSPTDFKKVNKFSGKVELDWAKMRQAAADLMG